MATLIGQTLKNRYRVEESLGRGGMAEVYRVFDQERGVTLAMKVLREDLSEDRVFLRRFQREAQNLAKLQHPNIVRFYGLEQEGPLAFILMDYIEGLTLRRVIFDAGEPLPMQRVLAILQPVCSALNYAHRQGVVHCDLKSANIMLDKYERVYLTDFGIARMTDVATSTLVGAGTPAYMAPELIMGKDPTPQSDIYALGVVLFEMLTGGERPFTGESADATGTTAEKVRWEQLHLEPPSVMNINPELPVEVDAIITRCLAKDPQQRFTGDLDVFSTLRDTTLLEVDVAGSKSQSKKAQSSEVGKDKLRKIVSEGNLANQLDDKNRIAGQRGGTTEPIFNNSKSDKRNTQIELNSRIGSLTQNEDNFKSPKTVNSGIKMLFILIVLIIIFAFIYFQLTNEKHVAISQRTLQPIITLGVENQTRTAQYISSVATVDAYHRSMSATSTSYANEINRLATVAAIPVDKALPYVEKSILEQINNPVFVDVGTDNGVSAGNYNDDYLECSEIVSTSHKNFILEAEIINPPDIESGWNYGVLFRDIGNNEQYRINFNSNGDYWSLENGISDTRQNGIAPQMDLSANGKNLINLIILNEKGWLYINHILLFDNMDLSARMNAGELSLCTDMYNDSGKSGQVIRMKNIRLWIID